MIKQFKLNVPLKGFSAGKIISLECDEEGTPYNLYWFRRFKDSKVDNCISPVGIEKEKKLKDKNHESI